MEVLEFYRRDCQLQADRTTNFIHDEGLLHSPDLSLGDAGVLAQEYERPSVLIMAPTAPARVLKYIKFPDTKGVITVKAVETTYSEEVRKVSYE